MRWHRVPGANTGQTFRLSEATRRCAELRSGRTVGGRYCSRDAGVLFRGITMESRWNFDGSSMDHWRFHRLRVIPVASSCRGGLRLSRPDRIRRYGGAEEKAAPDGRGGLTNCCVCASLPRRLRGYFFFAFLAALAASSSRAACAAARRATGHAERRAAHVGQPELVAELHASSGRHRVRRRCPA